MNWKEFIYTAITFGFCNSFINKIIAIAFSLIKLGLYLRIYFYLKNWNKETEDLKSLLIFQLCFEGFIIINSSLMIIFSKYLNRKHLYRIFRAFTIIIVLFLFFNILIDICSYAHIKYLQFPDLFRLNEDPIFNYTEDTYYSLNNFLIKNTKKINISLLNKDIFEYTYLTKDNSGEKIKVSDTTNFKIIFDRVNKYENIMPYQERHTLELNFPMKLEMTIIIIDILSYFLWNNIKIRHEKLIQNKGGKIYGKKIVYVGYYTGFMECNHDEQMEKIALEEIKRNPNYISDGEIGSCFSSLLEQIKILISSFGSLVTFIVLIVQRNKRNFKDNALHFPFSITLFGGDLYLYLLIFLCVNSGLDLFIIQRIELCSNHHKFINDKSKQKCGAIFLSTFGLVYLFFSLCGILGSLFFIIGEIYSNGNLYIKTSCIDSDITCYDLFDFSSNFPLDTKKYNQIFYYIYLKKISKKDEIKNLAISILILLIYFIQFYEIFFDIILLFNCDCSSVRFGKCQVHDFIVNDKGGNTNIIQLNEISVIINKDKQYYLNNINDSYFKEPNNNKPNNNNNEIKNVRISEYKENNVKTTNRIILPPLNKNKI